MPELLDQVQTECRKLETQPNHRRNRKIARLPKETRTQLLEALKEHGDQALEQRFRDRPGRYFQVFHAVCRQSDTALKLEKHRYQNPAPVDSSQIKPNQGPELHRTALPLPPCPSGAPVAAKHAGRSLTI